MQRGRPRMIFNLKDAHIPSSPGSYIAWSTPRRDGVFWQCLKPTKKGRPRQANFVSATRFYRKMNGTEHIRYLSINQDGLFLVGFARKQFWQGIWYSPLRMKGFYGVVTGRQQIREQRRCRYWSGRAPYIA
ncbi:hypothetical protein BJX66DRAFT_102007 [Aspergillus keveii]|uniref:Uncharacterized protein n=1 Tax=Aspergillus keveii TaxID=714993 RepID=A0ABR4GQX8_9EURO